MQEPDIMLLMAKASTARTAISANTLLVTQLDHEPGYPTHEVPPFLERVLVDLDN